MSDLLLAILSLFVLSVEVCLQAWFPALVVTLAGYSVPHTATRVAHVAHSARDKVRVAMKNCLASGLASVHAYVEAGY